jgi:hypothetical protein
MLKPQTVLIMGTWKFLAGIGIQYDAYMKSCSAEELCDEIQTQFSRLIQARIIIIIIISSSSSSSSSHKPFNLTHFLLLTQKINLF